MNKRILKHRKFEILVSLFFLLVTLTIFSQTVIFDFVHYDDLTNISRNPYVLDGINLRSIAWAFSSGGKLADYNPLTWLTHMIDTEIYGLWVGGRHLTNVLLHAANATLLFLVLRFMTGALWPSAFVATLFAVHPLHVESVAWITERRDVLYSFFWILTIGAYARYAQRPSSFTRYFVTFLVLMAALLSKSMAVTLPFVLLLLDYWPLGRLWPQQSKLYKTPHLYCPQTSLSRLVIEKVPFLTMSIVVSVVTLLINMNIGAVFTLESLPISTRIANALISYVAYIGKMFWPSNLAVLYPLPVNTFPMWKTLASLLLLVFVSVLVIRFFKKLPYLTVGWLWYLGTLVPVIGLVQAGSQSMADRYSYIPLIGLFIMIAWGVPDIVKRLRYKKILLSLSSAVLLSILLICTWIQVGYWKDTITLFEHALDVTSNNYVIHNNLGAALNRQGRVEEGISHFLKALRIKPDYYTVHNNLGVTLNLQGRFEEAIPHFREALSIRPDYYDAHRNLGFALAQEGRLDKAIFHYYEALRINPDDADTHFNLGNALARHGSLEEAITHFQEALRINPNDADAHNNLGAALVEQGKLDEAVFHFRETLRINPDNMDARSNLESVLMTLKESQ